MTEIYLGNKRFRLDPGKAVGKGGEADVFNIGDGRVVKLFKPPTHPDFDGLAHAQEAARQRIREHQEKLLAFPTGLPSRVVSPLELARTKSGDIAGYAMPFLSGTEVLLAYSDRSIRKSVSGNEVVALFRDLHATLTGIHAAKVVIGDFNDLNVLVKGSEAYVIDADSMQYGKWLCSMFTTKFVDPLLCDPRAAHLELARPHNPASDWYAFVVMLMQSLVFVDPYGGVYRPKDQQRQVKQGTRPLQRITVFNPEVRYPKPAVPYGYLPDELLGYLQRVFEKDERGAFPAKLFDTVVWTTCTACGTEHARSHCPACRFAAPAAIKHVVVTRGQVTATTVFRTRGVILSVEKNKQQLMWLAYENGSYRREDGAEIIKGALDRAVRYRLQKQATYLAKGEQIVKIVPGKAPETLFTNTHAGLPVFAVNDKHCYTLASGRLERNGVLGQEHVGDVLEGQTLVWAGPTFGFGFYRAANLHVAFVFQDGVHGVNDAVALPRLPGQLVNATCRFTSDRCWFFAAFSDGGKIKHRCYVINASGVIEGAAEAEAGDGSWLGTIGGGAAVQNFLLAPTDDGVVRVEVVGTSLNVTKTFPDTEPFVDAASRLFALPDGLYVVSAHEIVKLVIT